MVHFLHVVESQVHQVHQQTSKKKKCPHTRSAQAPACAVSVCVVRLFVCILSFTRYLLVHLVHLVVYG